MNLKYCIVALVTFSLLGGMALPIRAAEEENKTESKEKAPKDALSRQQAEKIALAKVPGGKIKDGELENENGKWIWSFDIGTAGSKNISEVQIDAVTGAIVDVATETPADQEKEKQEDAKEAKSDGWNANLSNTDETLTNTGRNTYFILEPGYQLVLAGKEDGKQTELTITVLDETQDINGVPTRIVEERETADGKLVEVSRNFFAIGATTKNAYYFGEDVDIYKGDKVVHEGAWREGVKDAKRGIMIPGTIKIGDRYYQEQAPGVAMDRGENISASETAKTPAGSFNKCLKVKETSAVESGTEFKLYAPEVGLVKEGDLKLVRHGFIKK